MALATCVVSVAVELLSPGGRLGRDDLDGLKWSIGATST